MQAAFVDTSAWLAAVDRRAADHPLVSGELRALEGRLVTSNYVLDEAVTLVRRRVGWPVAHRLGGELLGGVLARLVRVSEADEKAAWSIFSSYSDHVLSYTDCTSFAVMRRLGLSVAITLDADFRAFGLDCRPYRA